MMLTSCLYPRRDVHHIDEPDFLGLGLTSRKNLCVHETVSKEKKGKAVDGRCRDLTCATTKAKYEREVAANEEEEKNDPIETELCSWHEVRRLFHLISYSKVIADLTSSLNVGIG